MTSIADSSILTNGLVSARGSGAQHATSSYDQGYGEGGRRGGRRHVLARLGATGLGGGVVKGQRRSDLLRQRGHVSLAPRVSRPRRVTSAPALMTAATKVSDHTVAPVVSSR
jgi:hypothetical protein